MARQRSDEQAGQRDEDVAEREKQILLLGTEIE